MKRSDSNGFKIPLYQAKWKMMEKMKEEKCKAYKYNTHRLNKLAGWAMKLLKREEVE